MSDDGNTLEQAFAMFEQLIADGTDPKTIRESIKEVSSEKGKSYWRDGKQSTQQSDFFDFFSVNFTNTRRDLFRNVVFTTDIDKYSGWSPIENFIKALESHASVVGLSPTYLSRHLANWCLTKKPELLIDIPEWDGTDHILDALQRITVGNIEHELFVELMKDWFSKIVRRMHHPKVQNRLPIFRGRQGLGKDFCIRAMTEGFGRYANEIDFDQHNKTEVFRVIKNLAVGIIPEFDETKSSSISVLKSVITAESIEMRALYKNESESIPIRTSFISASNFDDVLRDSSGNRRFMVFDLETIEHTFEEVDGPQIAAQCFQLAKDKYKASAGAERAMKEIIKSETPESPDKMFVEEVNEFLISERDRISKDKQDHYLGNIEAGGQYIPDKIRWFQISDKVTHIAGKYGFRVKRAQQVMKRAGMTNRDENSTFYFPAAIL